MLSETQTCFLRTAAAAQALRFGEFTLKSGRISPYFFNAGAFCDGQSLAAMAAAYAEAIIRLQQDGVAFDVIFGPAYKGIPLAAAVAVTLQTKHGMNLPWAFNRKEAKDHGEGGMTVGAALAGKRVLIVDDVLTAGTAVRESLQLLAKKGAAASALVVALDREEKLDGCGESALQQLVRETGITARAVITFRDLLMFVQDSPAAAAHLPAMLQYRERYGV